MTAFHYFDTSLPTLFSTTVHGPIRIRNKFHSFGLTVLLHRNADIDAELRGDELLVKLQDAAREIDWKIEDNVTSVELGTLVSLNSE